MSIVIALAMLATVVVLPQSNAFANSQCTTGTYSTADEAKANYGNDCGQPFENTSAFRCDWVPGGWQCSGPGSSTTGDSASTNDTSTSRPPTPSIITIEKEPTYVNVVWQRNDRIKGVNVYRDGTWLASVNSPNNVYNDFGGNEGATYELVAYGYDTDEYSERASAVAANSQMDPVRDLHFELLSENRLVLNWTRANSDVSTWNVYRNNTLWRVLRSDEGYKDEVFDVHLDSAFTYSVEAVRGDLASPRVGIHGPAVDEYLSISPTGRSSVKEWPGNNRPPVTGLPTTNAATRSLAATAEASSADAQVQHAEFEFARNGMASAFVGPGTVFNPRNWGWFGIAGLQTRQERIEAEAANTKAFNDLQAYEDCISSACGDPVPTNTGGTGTGDSSFEGCPCSNSLTDHEDPEPGGDPEDYSGGAG